jgi:hypothetical protein
MADDGRSIQELFSTASSQIGNLLRSELRLAKAEVSANLSSAGTALALVGGGLSVVIAALVLLLMAVSAWLQSRGMSEGGADLLAAVFGLVVGGGLAWVGIGKLRSDPIAPTRTIEQVSEDASAIKERLK